MTSMGADAKRALRVLRKGPAVATTSARPFPPCMRRHLRRLHEDHHLRNTARFQLTLFFKGVDLTADETLAVWRSQFAHGRFADFQREHRYHVRHAYGLEGKMADYPPHPCEKLARREAEVACPFAGVGRRPRRANEWDSARSYPRRSRRSARTRSRRWRSAARRGRRALATSSPRTEEAEATRRRRMRRRRRRRRPRQRRRARCRRGGHRAPHIPARLLRRERVARGGGARAGPGPGPGAGTGAGRRRAGAPARRHLAIELEGSESETEEDAEGNPNAWHGAVNELTW